MKGRKFPGKSKKKKAGAFGKHGATSGGNGMKKKSSQSRKTGRSQG